MITIEQAKKLNTKRLLTYYKMYGRAWDAKYFCGCCCEPLWDLHSSDKYLEEEYDKEKKYWSSIKEILNTRENINDEQNRKKRKKTTKKRTKSTPI